QLGDLLLLRRLRLVERREDLGAVLHGGGARPAGDDALLLADRAQPRVGDAAVVEDGNVEARRELRVFLQREASEDLVVGVVRRVQQGGALPAAVVLDRLTGGDVATAGAARRRVGG